MGRGLSAGARISRWIDRGLEWQHGPHPAGRALAERRYLRAIRAVESVADAAAGVLARAWMNLGNVRADGPKPGNAIGAYDRAIASLAGRALTPEEGNLLGAAWLNRGVLLLRSESDSAQAAALDSFDAAIEILAKLVPTGGGFVQRNLAAAWMNRAAALELRRDPTWRAAAERALELIASLEVRDRAAAEIGLKARLLWLGTGGVTAADAARANTLLRDGLALPVGDLGQLRTLFVVGQHHIRRHAPASLADFVVASLRPGAALAVDFLAHLTAQESTTVARQQEQRRLLAGESDAGGVGRLRSLADAVDWLRMQADAIWPGAVESVWLRARAHELAGRPAAARTEWLRHLRHHPDDARASAAFETWPEHRGTGPAARRFAAQ